MKNSLMTAALAIVMLVGFLAADAFAASVEVVTATGNGATITLTYPSRFRTSYEYEVTVEIIADDPGYQTDWYIKLDGTTVDSGSADSYYITRTITSTSYTSGLDKWQIGARMTHTPPLSYCTVTRNIMDNLNNGGPTRSTDAKYFIGASYVDLASGNLFLDYQATNIAQTAGNNLPHNLTLYYNSKAGPYTDTVCCPLGNVNNNNWTHTFNQSIKVQPDDSKNIVYIDADGRRIWYRDDNLDGTYESVTQYGEYSTVVSSTGFVLTKKDRTAYNFNTGGYLTSITNTNGASVTLTYSGNDLVTITLPNSRTIALGYSYINGKNRITSITDPDSNVTTISYNSSSGLLEEISQTNGWYRQFTYQSGSARISSVVKPTYDINTDTVEFGYTSTDKRVETITKTINGSAKTTSFTYADYNKSTVIQDYAGISSTSNWEYTIDSFSAITDASGNTTINTFDTRYKLLLNQTDPNSNAESYQYDAWGNVLTYTDASSNVTSYVYGDSANPDLPTTITDAAGIITSYTYDSAGNMTRKVRAYGASDEQRIDYAYNSDGSLDTETVDPSGLALVTDYDYTSGYLTAKTVDMGAGDDIVYNYTYTTLGYLDYAYDPRYPTSVYTDYDYDVRGNLTLMTEPITTGRSVVTQYAYNYLDKVYQKTDDYGTGTLNVITLYTYDNQGWLQSTVYDYGNLNLTSAYAYDDTGKLISTTDPAGATTEYDYYDNDWLYTTTKQLTSTGYAETSYYYDANGNLTGMVDPMGHATSYTYTALNQLSSTIDPESNTITYGYNSVGLMTSSRDARNNTTTYYYDDLRRLTSIITPESIVVDYFYDKAGRITQINNPYTSSPDDRTYYGYDNANRVVTSTVNTHTASQFFYDASGNLTGVIDPAGDAVSYTYNYADWRYWTTVDPDGLAERTAYRYDNLGRTTVITAANGTALATVTTMEYDNAGRVITSYTGSITYATTYEYNARGQVTKVTDANGNATDYAYDTGGWLTRNTNALGFYTDYEYNLDGQQTKMTYYRSGSPVETTYTYYDNHLLYTQTLPGFSGNDTTTFVYDENGNLYTKEDPNGNTTTYGYDDNNRLTSKTYQDSSTVSYTYSASSNLLTIVDANSNIANDYDDLNRVITVTDNVMSKVIAYSYYEDGLRASMTDPEGNLTEYGYDNAKRLAVLTSTINSTMNVTRYNYNELGMYTAITYANNAYVTYSYDATTRWLTGLYNKDSSGSEVSTFEYTYDYVGNRTTAVLTNTALSVLNQTITYTYDTIYQLEAETRTDSAGTNIYRYAWAYDGVGNRLTQTKDGSLDYNYAYNDGNQMISCTSGATTTIFQYDSNGNPITETRGANNWIHTYDWENRMVRHDAPGTDTAHAYDALGRKISSTIGASATTRFIYDGQNVIGDYNNAGVIQTVYVTPFLDTNLIMAQGENTYYYMQDGLGSVVNMLDGACNTINSYDYEAFGEKRGTSEQVSNRYRFTGREYEMATDSAGSNTNRRYYYRGRFYRTSFGRFTQRDPIGYLGGLNIYSYCGNNPVNYTDPSGHNFITKLATKIAKWLGKKTPGKAVTKVRNAGFIKQVKTYKDRSIKSSYKKIKKNLDEHIKAPKSKHHDDEIRVFKEKLKILEEEAKRRNIDLGAAGAAGVGGAAGAGESGGTAGEGTHEDKGGDDSEDVSEDQNEDDDQNRDQNNDDSINEGQNKDDGANEDGSVDKNNDDNAEQEKEEDEGITADDVLNFIWDLITSPLDDLDGGNAY